MKNETNIFKTIIFNGKCFKKTIVLKNNQSIINDKPLFTIVNDDPSLPIVNQERRREETDMKGMGTYH